MVPGTSVTIFLSSRQSLLTIELFPTFGLPIMDTLTGFSCFKSDSGLQAKLECKSQDIHFDQ
ncbi:MAG: hypothetical protein U9Q66_03705 [Patescibacteria group bacterium]|nr:hypothetical protein [Patescibacteria group bacterium]